MCSTLQADLDHSACAELALPHMCIALTRLHGPKRKQGLHSLRSSSFAWPVTYSSSFNSIFCCLLFASLVHCDHRYQPSNHSFCGPRTSPRATCCGSGSSSGGRCGPSRQRSCCFRKSARTACRVKPVQRKLRCVQSLFGAKQLARACFLYKWSHKRFDLRQNLNTRNFDLRLFGLCFSKQAAMPPRRLS